MRFIDKSDHFIGNSMEKNNHPAYSNTVFTWFIDWIWFLLFWQWFSRSIEWCLNLYTFPLGNEWYDLTDNLTDNLTDDLTADLTDDLIDDLTNESIDHLIEDLTNHLSEDLISDLACAISYEPAHVQIVTLILDNVP